MTLKECRRAKGMSQQMVADQMGVHVNTYINWEKHPDKIPIGICISLCNVLETSPDSIIFCEETLQNVEQKGVI